MASSLSILRYRQPVAFHIGDVIQRSWGVLSRNLFTFLLLCGLAGLPTLILELTASRPGVTARGHINWSSVGISWLSGLLAMFAEAMVIYAAFQDLRGRKVSALESLSRGLERFLSVFVVSLLVGLAIGVGIMLLIIPGLIFWAMYAVALPVCVVEREGGLSSLSRSQELTSGHRWPIFGVAIAIFVVTLIGSALIRTAFLGASLVALYVMTWVWTTVVSSFSSVYTAILYHDLRAVHEGIGIDEIASVFD
jgi:hypothetical protein